MLSCPGALEGAKTAACTSLVTAPKAIEALSPGALLECHGPSGGRMAADAGIRWEGCLFGYWTSYVQYAHGTFRFLRSWEAFKQTFAPVDTPAQALAFAVALTGAFPLYSMVPPKNYKLVGSDVQPSYARAQSGDFRVRLFSVHHCVMQPSWEAIEYRVTSEGDVDVLSRKDIFAPKSGPANQCCVD